MTERTLKEIEVNVSRLRHVNEVLATLSTIKCNGYDNQDNRLLAVGGLEITGLSGPHLKYVKTSLTEVLTIVAEEIEKELQTLTGGGNEG